MSKNKRTFTSGPERLSGRNLWSFSLGGIGRDAICQLFNTYLLTATLLTKQLTTAEFALIGIIISVSRIFDGLIDPFIGALIEATHTRWGKFKPWIFFGAISNAVVVFLMFWMPLTGMEFVIFFAVAQIFLSITFSANDISYWSMIPALTSHSADRDKLSSAANVCATLGNGLTIMLVPMFTSGSMAIGGSAVTAYPAMAAIIGVVFVLCTAMTVLGVKEKPLPPVRPTAEKPKVFQQILTVMKNNDQLRWAFLIAIIHNTGSIILGGFSTWYVYFRFGYEGVMVSLFGIITGAAGAILMVYPLMAKKFTRKTISKIALGLILLGYGLMLIIGLATRNASGSVFYPLAFCGVFYAAGQAFFYQVLTITIANTVEYNEWKTGKREESIIFSLRPLASQLGSSFQMGIVTLVLSVLGVANITSKISEQENLVSLGLLDVETKLTNIAEIIAQVPDTVTTWLLVCMTVLPILVMSTAMILYWKKSKLDEVTYEKLCAEIRARKEG